MRVWFVAATVVGCGFDPTPLPRPGETMIDGGSGSCASATEQFSTCGFGSGSDLAIGGSAIYDTDTGSLMIGAQTQQVDHMHVAASGGIQVDALIVRGFTLSAKLTIIGALPLAIVATGDVMIGGELFVTPGLVGARATCDAKAGANDTSGGGGGGGGAFRGNGGSGAPGDSATAAGGTGGVAQALPTTLVGGCPGGAGGDGSNGGIGGSGGAGGGVLLIATFGAISIMPGGGIAVNGAGGQSGGADKTGGGGGGAGGLAVLEASSVSNGGYVVANGGGGAEGENAAGAGNAGADGNLSATPARGGGGATSVGGDGGSGGAGDVLDGVASTQQLSDGGGGGGGGVGYLGVTHSAPGQGVYSPNPSTWP
jgi:hypothetical protein